LFGESREMEPPLISPPTRRAALGVGVLAATALVGRAGAEPKAAGPLDLTSEAGRLRAYMLMRGALDDRLVIGFVAGRYYGVVDDEIKPLYGVHAATFSRFKTRAEGGYNGAGYEVAFFTDLDTGKALETWANPYTGETVSVPKNTTFPPGVFVIGADLETRLPTRMPGVVSQDKVWPIQTSGDDVWITQDTRSAFTAPGAAKAARYNELVTLRARASDLARPGALKVPTEADWTSVVSWRPWLKMGDRPGHLWGAAHGRSCNTIDELPAPWLAATAQYRPEVLKHPGGTLANLLKGVT
jgi:hypothetical protein